MRLKGLTDFVRASLGSRFLSHSLHLGKNRIGNNIKGSLYFRVREGFMGKEDEGLY